MIQQSISIIVPIYNVVGYIEQCLDSILTQTNGNYFTLLVDDGSTDNSAEIAKRYAVLHPDKFQYFNKVNGGLSDARNYGLNKVSTDYVIFLDADDYLAPNTIDVLSAAITTSGSDIICFGMVEVTETAKFVRNIPAITESSKQLWQQNSPKKTSLIQSAHILTDALPNACNKYLKTSIFKANSLQFPKGLWYEDLATTPKLYYYAKHIQFIEENLYFYRGRAGSITQTYTAKVMDMLTVLESLTSFFNEKSVPSSIASSLTTLSINMLMKTMVRICQCQNSNEQKTMISQLKVFLEKEFNRPIKTIYSSNSKLVYKFITIAVLLGFNRSIILFIKSCQRAGLIK